MKTLKFTIPLVIAFALLISISSCKDEKNVMLEKDKKLLEEKLSSSKVAIYKSIKVLLRSADFSEKSDDITEIQELSNYIFGKLIDVHLKDKKLEFKNLYHVFIKFNKLKSKLKKIDEDKLPTILEAITSATNEISGKKENVLNLSFWNSSIEHLFLSVLLNDITDHTLIYGLYEASLIDETKMQNNEIKPIAMIYKSMVYNNADLYYLSEDLMTRNIKSLKKSDIESSKMLKNKIFNEEKQIKQLIGISYLIRGFSRNHMHDDTKKSEAIKDFTNFLNISEKNGLNNELSSIAGIYVYNKKGDSKKTISFIKQLEKSKNLNKEQKQYLMDLKKSIKADGKINLKHDLLTNMKSKDLLKNIISDIIKENEYYKQVKKTEAGEILIELPEYIYDNHKEFKGVKSKSIKYIKKVKNLFN